MTHKESLLAALAKEDEQVLAVAYLYAQNVQKYGVDITQAAMTAVQNVAMINRVYAVAYADAMKQFSLGAKDETTTV